MKSIVAREMMSKYMACKSRTSNDNELGRREVVRRSSRGEKQGRSRGEAVVDEHEQ